MIRALRDNDAAKITCIGLELNRIALIERRLEKLNDLQRRHSELKATRNVQLRQTLLAALESYAYDPSTEYQACLSTFYDVLKNEA